MTTYNTQNPLGSSDPRDLYDNAENLDNFVNGAQPAYDDRLGKSRRSWQSVEDQVNQQEVEFNAAQNDREGVFNAYLVSAGYQFAGDYAAGIEITQYNQVVRDASGEFWRVSGSTTLPYTTTGAGLPEGGAFVYAGDAVLRQELGLTGEGKGLGLIGGVPFVTPEMFGAVGDGAYDDTAAVQSAFDVGGVVLASRRYRVTSTIIGVDGMTLDGHGEIISDSVGATLQLGSNSTVRNITLTGVNTPEPLWGMFAYSESDITIEDCTLNNQRIRISNSLSEEKKNVFLRGNKFYCDFSAYNWQTEQLDVVTIHGVNGIKIEGNVLEVTNVHRCFKISDNPSFDSSTTVSDYSSYDVVFRGNTIKGSGHAVVYSCHLGQTNLRFSENYIKVAGFAHVINEKTRKDASLSNFEGQIYISGNYIESEKTAIRVSGTYGLLSTIYVGDRETKLTVIGNNIVLTGDSLTGTEDSLIAVNALHEAKITDNKLFAKSPTSSTSLSMSGCRLAEFSGNDLDGLHISLDQSTSTSAGAATVRGFSGDISILSNTIFNYMGPGAVYVASAFRSPNCNLVIADNKARPDETNLTSRFLSAANQDIRVESLRCSRNDYNGGSSVPILFGGTARRKYESDNSWNPSVTYSNSLPTEGDWRRGDIVYNTSPFNGNEMGWICSASSPQIGVPSWEPDTAYTVGSEVATPDGLYVCTAGGTSGESTPTGTGTGIVDGTCTWDYSEPLGIGTWRTFGDVYGA